MCYLTTSSVSSISAVERYLPDAIDLVLHQDFSDALDDAALSSAVMSTAKYLAHIPLE